MEKKFRLPKVFGIKWLEALRSGMYQQTNGQLCKHIDGGINTLNNETPLNKIGFCCLGVAGHLACNDITKLSANLLFNDLNKIEGVPSELELQNNEAIVRNPLVNVLTKLNDGYASRATVNGLNIREPFKSIFEGKGGYDVRYTFNDIADFIEDNVEFY